MSASPCGAKHRASGYANGTHDGAKRPADAKGHANGPTPANHRAWLVPPVAPPLEAVADGATRATPAPPPTPAATLNHAADGRFLPGNHCGRGNPHARRQAELRAALTEAVGQGRLERMAAKLAAQAEAGDEAAAKLL